MDNNKLIGFALIMLLIVVYYSYFSPNQVPILEDEISEIETPTKEKTIVSNNINEDLNEDLNEDYVNNYTDKGLLHQIDGMKQINQIYGQIRGIIDSLEA